MSRPVSGMSALGAVIVGRPGWVIAAVIALTLALGAAATNLEFDTSLDSWFLDGDPDLIIYRAFHDTFSSDEILSIVVLAPDVFDPAVLARIDLLTDELSAFPHVRRVRSLTNVRVAIDRGDYVSIGRLIGELPATLDQAAVLRAEALQRPMLVGALVNEAANAASIVIELDVALDLPTKLEMVERVRALAAEPRFEGMDLRIVGIPMLDHRTLQISQEDFVRLVPLTVLLIAVLTGVILRRFWVTLLPIGVVTLALVWTFGLMALLGSRVTPLTTPMVQLVLAVASADAIHLVWDFFSREHEASGEPPVLQTMKDLIRPCFYTTLTTVAGLASLCISQLKPLRDFGIFAGVAVTLALVITFTFGAALLSLARAEPTAPGGSATLRGLNALLARLGSPSRGFQLASLGLTLALVGLALASAPRIEIGANLLGFYHDDDPAYVDVLAVEDALGGMAPLEYVIRTRPDGLLDPDTVQAMDAFATELEAQGSVTKTLSVADNLRDLHGTMLGMGTPARLPRLSADLIGQYYLLLEGEEDFPSFMQGEYSETRISARVKMGRAAAAPRELPLSADAMSSLGPAVESVDVTGYVKMVSNMQHYLLESQIESIGLAFGIVTLIIGAMLRSRRLIFVALLPSLAPVVMGVGAMSLLGIKLNPGTAMIGTVALGVVVDDAVHFLFRFRQAYVSSGSIAAGVKTALARAGAPIIATSIVIAGATAVFTLGSFTPNVDFGIVFTLVIVLALLTNLCATPAVLLRGRPPAG